MRSDLYLDLVGLLEEMQSFKGIHKFCDGSRICIFPDVDNDDELPTLVRIHRDDNDIMIIPLSEMSDDIEKEIDTYLEKQKNKICLMNEKSSYIDMIKNLKNDLKFKNSKLGASI